MTVTKIVPHSARRYRVFLDGQFAFILYKGELASFGIREGCEVKEETVGRIYSEVLLKRAKMRALHLLEDMDRTEAELCEKLRQGEYPQEIADAAVSYVKSFGYLDDRRYAENYVRSKSGSKSRKEIQAALRNKGIDRELISQAFESCFEEGTEEEAIRRLLKKKRFCPDCADERELQKIYGFLGRKGFRYDTVRQVIQNYNGDA